MPLSNTFFIVRLRNSHNDECHKLMKSEILGYKCRGGGTPGGTDLEKGYGDVRPWRHPFHATPVVRKGPIPSKRVNSQDPLMRKFGNFSLYNLNFCQNFSSQALNLAYRQVEWMNISDCNCKLLPNDMQVCYEYRPT